MLLMFSHHEIVCSFGMPHMTHLEALEASVQAIQFRMDGIGYKCEDCIRRSLPIQKQRISMCSEDILRTFSAVKRKQRPVGDD